MTKEADGIDYVRDQSRRTHRLTARSASSSSNAVGGRRLPYLRTATG